MHLLKTAIVVSVLLAAAATGSCTATKSSTVKPDHLNTAAICSGTPNMSPVFTSAPTLVRTVPNGKLFKLQGGAQPYINLLHVYGTPYQMGYAAGQLIGDQANELLKEFMDYVESSIDQYIDFLPEFLRKYIEQWGVEAALDLTYDLTYDYTPKRFIDEIQGMADGSGIDFQMLVRVQMFPELIQAACTMFGAWGAAVKNTNGTLVQLRALDWSTDGPFQKFPLVTVYHPTEAGSNSAFATVGWSGFIGAITGLSSSPVGICEKVYYAYNGTQSRIGYPWPYVLRDILQFDVDIASATNRMVNAARTCAIWVGVGDGHSNQFRVFEYSFQYLNQFDDINFPAYDNHPLMPGLVWVDKHVQPSQDPCMTALLKQYYGSITPVVTLQQITAQFQTGDMHISIYDYANMHIYVSNASPADSQGNVVKAYDRPFVRIDLNQAFAEKPPVL